MKIGPIIFLFLLFMLRLSIVSAQRRLQFSGMTGTVLSHSMYNRNLDNRKSLGGQVSYLWDVSQDSIGYSKKISKKYIGISLYGLDMGDGFLNGEQSLRKTLPLMGFGTGGMVITGINKKFPGSLGVSSLGLQFGFGPMVVSKYYDAIKNSSNQAIGSMLNFGSQLKLQFAHPVSTNTFLSLGAEMFHVSNTNFQKPNVGLNYIQGSFSLIHNLDRKFSQKENHQQSSFKKVCIAKYQISTRTAFRQFRMDYPINYAVLILEADYGIQMKNHIQNVQNLYFEMPKMEWRLGFNYFYEMPRTVQKPDRNLLSLEARSELGLYVRTIFRMGWVDVFLDLGYYLVPPQADRINLLQKNKFIYNTIGSQYRISKDVFLIHRMKAHLQIADYLEMGLLFRL